MKKGGFALAATTDALTLEAEARDVADLVEFRMDTAVSPLDQLTEYDGELPVIATNRARWAGGGANDTGRLDELVAASRFDSVEYVDIELATARDGACNVAELRENGVKIIASYHDFDSTPGPDRLESLFDRCAQHGDIAKVATMPEDTSDTLRLLEATNAATERGIDAAGIAMGEVGSHTRVIGHLYGSTLGYAPLKTDETEYAPGQIPLDTLAPVIEIVNNWSHQHGSGETGIDATSVLQALSKSS